MGGGGDFEVSNHTGPNAPHHFRFCYRGAVGADSAGGDRDAELYAQHDDAQQPPKPDDVVMVVKDRMASTDVSQVLTLIPASELPRLRRGPAQPVGQHDRRGTTDGDRRRVFESARAAHDAGAITLRAQAYLSEWAQGTRRREQRPRRYGFLDWNAGRRAPAPNPPAPDPPRPHPLAPRRPVVVAPRADRPQQAPEHEEEEEEEDEEEGPLSMRELMP